MARRTASTPSTGGHKRAGGGTAARAAGAPSVPDQQVPTEPSTTVNAGAGGATPPAPRPQLIRRSPEETAALRASLADSEAQTHALRAELDQLRHDLESGVSLAPAAPAGPRRRTATRALTAAAVAGLATIGLAVALVAGHDGSAGTTPTGPAPSGPAGGAPAPGGGAVQAPLATPDPLPWPGGAVSVPAGLPAAGPGIDAPGSDVTVAADPDQVHLDVYEQVVIPLPRPAQLQLAPALLTGLKPPLGTAALSVQDLQAEVDGRRGELLPSGPANAWTLTLPAGATPARVVLRYRVTGAFVRQEPAPRGRVTVVLAPLSAPAELAAGMPVELRYLGAGVTAMTCPQAVQNLQLCGSPAGTSWQARLPPGGGVVLVQATR